jgi:hypothetical protein
VWMSEEGYSHQAVGQKVSQIQAVLVRRCAAIGELQQHLLRARWQRGVAQWGFLGQGWAAVAGFDGSIEEEPSFSLHESPSDTSLYLHMAEEKSHPSMRRLSVEFGDVPYKDLEQQTRMKPSLHGSHSGGKGKKSPYKAAGGIFVDDPGRLAEWSVEAMSLIRRHLYRSGNGMVVLPHQSNWEEGPLPTWATEVMQTVPEETESTSTGPDNADMQLTISNLPVLVLEVEELLDVMEGIMTIQSHRRLDKMRPPSWRRRSWYIFAATLPVVGGLSSWLMINKGLGKSLVRSLSHSLYSFFTEHLRDPVVAM